MELRGPRSLVRLLASWIAWWLILVAWKLGPAIPALLRVSQEGAKGSANVSFGDGGFTATITEGTTTAWEGHISFIALVLLAGVPPLILWALWLRRSGSAPVEMIGEGSVEIDGRLREVRVSEERRR